MRIPFYSSATTLAEGHLQNPSKESLESPKESPNQAIEII